MIDGEKFQACRKKANLTQEQLAERLGISTTVVRRAEYEMKDFSLAVAATAAQIMGCKVDDFLKTVRIPS